MNKTMEKTGWWSVSFGITLNGERICFDELSDVSQEHILTQIAEGYCSGEVVEEFDNEEE